MTEIKAVVHDWDDTIAEGFEHYKNFYYDFGNHYKLSPPTDAGLKKSWGQRIEDIVYDQWPELTLAQAGEMVQKYIPLRTDNREVKMFPGVKKTIEILSNRYLLAILSSGNYDQIMKVYRSQLSSTRDYHEIVVCPPKYSIKKDHPDVLVPVMEAFAAKGVTREEVIMAGDHLYDKLAAETQGLLFIAVTTGVTSREEFLDMGVPDENILNSFSEIFTVLNR